MSADPCVLKEPNRFHPGRHAQWSQQFRNTLA